MESLSISAGVISIIADIFLVIIINHSNKIEQNYISYFLWAILDIIIGITTILQGGHNYWLPFGYAIGTILVGIVLVYKVKIKWTWVETVVLISIAICLVVWYQLGNKAGNIASVVALGIASIPQTMSTYKRPETTPTRFYIVFTLAGLMSFIGGENWVIKDKLYSFFAFVFCLVITIISLRKVEPNKN